MTPAKRKTTKKKPPPPLPELIDGRWLPRGWREQWEPNDFIKKMEWAGIPMFQCALCPWNTIKSVDHLIDHIGAHHVPPVPPTRPGHIVVVNTFGHEQENRVPVVEPAED